MSMMLDSAFVDRSQFSIGGVKRMIIGGGGGVIGGPQNIYSQIEANAERLMMSFPQKDKVQLIKLLEELDNRIEVAYDILSSELTQTRNVLEVSMLSGNNSEQNQNQELQEQRQEQSMNPPPAQRRALYNLKPKTSHKNNVNKLSSSCQKQSENQLYQQPQSISQLATIIQSQDVAVSEILNCNNDAQQLTIKQESAEFSSDSQIKNISDVEQSQPSFINTTNSSRQNSQLQSPSLRRLKDIPQINQFQKNLMEQIVPALLQELGNSYIQQAPQLIYEALRYYEEENRRAVQFEKILSSHDILLRAFANQYSKIQRCEKINAELLQEKQALTAERDKYKNLSQRLAIMFNSTNNYAADHIDEPPYNGGSGPREFCF